MSEHMPSHTPLLDPAGAAPSRFRAASPALAGALESGTDGIAPYVRVLYRRRWLAATVSAFVFFSVAVYTFTTAPIYEGHVQLLIQVGNPNVVSFKEVLESDRLTFTTDYYPTQYTILQSRTLARQTLDTLKLWQHPVLGNADRSFLERHLPAWAAK